MSSWYEDGELDDKAARKRGGGDGEFHESVVSKEDGKGEGGGSTWSLWSAEVHFT